MSKTTYFSLALAAELAIAVTLGASAYAQAPAPNPNPPSPTQQGGQLQQITVTGYVIPRVGEGPQPVTTLDQDFITKQADQTVTDVLQRLPSTEGNFAPTTTSGNSFSPASSSISLHGLGPIFSLVLVDGKRMPAFPFRRFRPPLSLASLTLTRSP